MQRDLHNRIRSLSNLVPQLIIIAAPCKMLTQIRVIMVEQAVLLSILYLIVNKKDIELRFNRPRLVAAPELLLDDMILSVKGDGGTGLVLGQLLKIRIKRIMLSDRHLSHLGMKVLLLLIEEIFVVFSAHYWVDLGSE